MPSHVYIPVRNPPRWYDRVMVHPFDNAVGVLCILFGSVMLLALTVEDYHPSSSLLRMPQWIGFAVSASISVGGILSLTGLHWTGETVSRGWHIERFGWLGVAAGLGGYGVAILFHFPGATTSWLIPLVLAFAAFVRFLSLVLIERNTRRTLTAVHEELRGASGDE